MAPYAGAYQDTADPKQMLETFVVESWIQYLRQRERLTTSDRMIRDHLLTFHQGDGPPKTSHMIYAREVEPFKNQDQTIR